MLTGAAQAAPDGGVMRYLVLFRAADFRDDYELRPGELDAVRRWCDEMEERGMTLTGSPLHPAREGATVRVQGGEILRSDGPFAETKEVVGGFEVLDCASLDEAIELVSRHPVAEYGSIELREIWPDDEIEQAP
jgi:hypothetical protein